MSLTYENLTERVLEEFPQLGPALASERKWWGEEKPGPHIVFGDIFTPFVVEQLRHGHETELKHIFSFLEVLARDEDARIQEVVALSVCQPLGRNPVLLSRARGYMGETTLQFSKDVEGGATV